MAFINDLLQPCTYYLPTHRWPKLHTHTQQSRSGARFFSSLQRFRFLPCDVNATFTEETLAVGRMLIPRGSAEGGYCRL